MIRVNIACVAPRSGIRSALSIAGSDPTGGAGLQADLQVFRLYGLHGTGVVTALTVQDTTKVHRVLPAFPSVVLDQLRVLLNDFQPDAVKIGMLATDDVVRNVLLGLAALDERVPVVIDPVLLASDGTELLERRAWHTLKSLFARAALVTPNLPEAERLAQRDVSSQMGVESAAKIFVEELGAQAVLIKGGHRSGRPDDLLCWRADTGFEQRWLQGERVSGPVVHGTGCALSSAIAAGLALGHPLASAIDEARGFVARGLLRATTLGAGAPVLVHS